MFQPAMNGLEALAEQAGLVLDLGDSDKTQDKG